MSTTAEKVLVHTRITGELLKRAQDWREQLQEHERLQKEAEEQIASTVKALVDNDRIYENQAEKVAEALRGPGGHKQALELLRELAAHQPVGAGMTPVGPKTAAAATTSRGPVDAPVANYDDTPAGRRFRERVLGAGF